jgi:hypothetical protein
MPTVTRCGSAPTGGPGEDDLFIAARVADFDLPWLPSALPEGLNLTAPIGLAADELFIEGDTTSYGAGGLDLFAGQLDADGTVGSGCNFYRETKRHRARAPCTTSIRRTPPR